MVEFVGVDILFLGRLRYCLYRGALPLSWEVFGWEGEVLDCAARFGKVFREIVMGLGRDDGYGLCRGLYVEFVSVCEIGGSELVLDVVELVVDVGREMVEVYSRCGYVSCWRGGGVFLVFRWDTSSHICFGNGSGSVVGWCRQCRSKKWWNDELCLGSW